MKKINFTQVFVDSLPVSVRLPFGIVNNIRITDINNEVHLDKQNMPYERNTWITVSQYDVTGEKVIAETEFNYFNMTKEKYAKGNFVDQMVQLSEFVKFVAPMDKSDELLTEYETFINNLPEMAKVMDKRIKATDLKWVNAAMLKISNKVIEILTPHFGKGELLKIIIACSNSGEHLNLPRESKGFLQYMDGPALVLPNKYVSWRKNKDKPKIAEPDLLDDETVVESSDILQANDDVDNLLEGSF